MDRAILQQAESRVRDRLPGFAPSCGLILGSGWGPVAEAFGSGRAVDFAEIPGLGRPGVAGHEGRLHAVQHAGLQTLIFQGRRHWYEGEGWTPIALPVYLLQKLGARVLVLTNAAGGVNPTFRAGHLMAITDHVNAMGTSPLIGSHDPDWGVRFPDQSNVYDRDLRRLLDGAAHRTRVPLRHGIYVAVTGPAYETPAEVRAFRAMGADAIGMSTVPEATLASAAGLKVAGLSCIANPAVSETGPPVTHERVVTAIHAALPAMTRLLLAFWEQIAERTDGGGAAAG